MTTGSLLLGLGIVLLVAAALAYPFLTPRSRAERVSRRQALLDQKDAVLDEIHQLDFDHETGKVPDQHYAAQRETLVHEAAELLRELDALGLNLPANESPKMEHREAAIEAAIRELRRAPESAPAPEPTPESEGALVAPSVASAAAAAAATVAVAPSKARTSDGQTRFCPQCGKARAADDRFCAYCGTSLTL